MINTNSHGSSDGTVRPSLAQHSSFVVDDVPWCVWDWRLGELNAEFIEGLDPSYFDYIAEAHGRALDAEGSDQHAAVGLRTSYHHAMEAFFALLGATIQAPDCVIGWFHKYTNQQLESLVFKIDHGQPVKTKLRLKHLSWQGLADAVFSLTSLPDKAKEQRIRTDFGQLWGRLADDFLSAKSTAEYNSFKHGMRLRAGGFHLLAGQEAVPGEPCPSEQMQHLGGSSYGSSFYGVERIDGMDKSNVRMVHHARNWSPDEFIARLQLLSISMRNVLSFLKVILGASPQSQQFVWPADPELFARCFQFDVGVNESSFNLILTKDNIVPQSKDQIVAAYEPSS
ncbi:MAG: hypothetical protein WCI73_11905 [Phycisphaerae bacterium]